VQFLSVGGRKDGRGGGWRRGLGENRKGEDKQEGEK
jgi:hypothetical protein